MKKVEVTCDQCGFDLTASDVHVGYRLSLTSEPLPSRGFGGARMSVATYPAISRDAHFCDKQCLKEWVEGGMVLG